MSQQIPDASAKSEPLGYATADQNRRPPLVTAVAIISICVACLGLLSNIILVRSASTQTGSGANLPITQQQMTAIAARRNAAMIAATQAVNLPRWRALTPKEISGVIDYINDELGAGIGGDSLNKAQIDTLSRMLSKQRQGIIDPGLALGTQTGGKYQIVRARVNN